MSRDCWIDEPDEDMLMSEEEAAEAFKEWLWEKDAKELERHAEFMRVAADMRRKEERESK